MTKGQTIQQHLQNSPCNQRSDEQLARSFSKLMMESKVRPALSLIEKQEGGAPMVIDQIINTDTNGTQTVFDILKMKHPEAKPPKSSAFNSSVEFTDEPYPIIFESINDSPIHTMAL